MLCGKAWVDVTGVMVAGLLLLLVVVVVLWAEIEMMPLDEESGEADEGMGECGGEALSLRLWLLTVFCCLELEGVGIN